MFTMFTIIAYAMPTSYGLGDDGKDSLLTTEDGCVITQLVVLGFKILCIDKIALHPLNLSLTTLTN